MYSMCMCVYECFLKQDDGRICIFIMQVRVNEHVSRQCKPKFANELHSKLANF